MTQPNVDYSQLRAMVFCREVHHADTGVTLVGIHDTRFSTAFPVRYEEELIMYVSFELLRPEPAHMEIQVKRPGSRDSESFAESVCDPDSSLVVIAPLPMATFEFNRPGKFNFALYVDHLLVGSTRIVVEQAPIHAAQARVQAN